MIHTQHCTRFDSSWIFHISLIRHLIGITEDETTLETDIWTLVEEDSRRKEECVSVTIDSSLFLFVYFKYFYLGYLIPKPILQRLDSQGVTWKFRNWLENQKWFLQNPNFSALFWDVKHSSCPIYNAHYCHCGCWVSVSMYLFRSIKFRYVSLYWFELPINSKTTPHVIE